MENSKYRDRDTRARSVTKAISWRILASFTTMMLVFAFTKELALSIEIGLFEIVIKLIVYYLHERAWQAIPIGRKIYEMTPEKVDNLAIDLAQEGNSESIKNKLRKLGYIE